MKRFYRVLSMILAGIAMFMMWRSPSPPSPSWDVVKYSLLFAAIFLSWRARSERPVFGRPQDLPAGSQLSLVELMRTRCLRERRLAILGIALLASGPVVILFGREEFFGYNDSLWSVAPVSVLIFSGAGLLYYYLRCLKAAGRADREAAGQSAVTLGRADG